MMFSKKDDENSQFTYRDYLEIQEKNWKLELQVQKKDEIIYELKKALSKRLYGVSDKELELVGPAPIDDEMPKPPKKYERKKYKRKAMMFMVPGGAITKEEWNDCQNLFHKDFDSGIGNNPIEKVIATPVDYGVQYLIIYKEEDN